MIHLNSNIFDVIVIGGGHAGIEAAAASARMKRKTLLITHDIDKIGQMSCNPSIGGIGKGQLVKEIDALGGLMANAIDQSGIQFKILNSSKGPAVRSTRAQADKQLYRQIIQNTLYKYKYLIIMQQEVDDLIIKKQCVYGIITHLGFVFYAKTVILTVGTFLNGKIFCGLTKYDSGRAGDPPSIDLANKLKKLPIRLGRLKTGTPPRLDSRTINFKNLIAQHSDDPLPVFSFLGNVSQHPKQIPCWLTYTNNKTHDIILENLKLSPMYNGTIKGIGPRYCPSIEDKVVRFTNRNAHQIFLEPEGTMSSEIYPNGISTSLPFDVQIKIIQSIKGLENAVITRPGYSIEYDFFDPRDLKLTLESKHINGLFFAGQINGTTGYEEAAAQGLLAGLNAALYVENKECWIPKRDQSYIGVLVDDLCTLGTKEPYRMFTSRAEHRLMLREDNADLRLTEIGRKLGLIDDYRWINFNSKIELIELERQRLRNYWIAPYSDEANKIKDAFGINLIKKMNGEDLLSRTNITYSKLTEINIFAKPINIKIAEQLEIQIKYEGYILRQYKEINKQKRNVNTLLPADIDYLNISGLSKEVVTKLNDHRPTSIGQASRISGITPAAISILLIYLKKYNALKK